MKYVLFVRGEEKIKYSESGEDADYGDPISISLPLPSKRKLKADFENLINIEFHVTPPDNGNYCDADGNEYCYAIYRVLVDYDTTSNEVDLSSVILLGAQFPRPDDHVEYMFPCKQHYLYVSKYPSQPKFTMLSYNEWDDTIHKNFLFFISKYYEDPVYGLTRHWSDRAEMLHVKIAENGDDPQKVFYLCMEEIDYLMNNTNIKANGDYFALLSALLEYFQSYHGSKSINEYSKNWLALFQMKQLLIHLTESLKDELPATYFFRFFHAYKEINQINEITHAIMKSKDIDELAVHCSQFEKMKAKIPDTFTRESLTSYIFS